MKTPESSISWVSLKTTRSVESLIFFRLYHRRPMPPSVLSILSSTANVPGPTCSQPARSLPLKSCVHRSDCARGDPGLTSNTTARRRNGQIPRPIFLGSRLRRIGVGEGRLSVHDEPPLCDVPPDLPRLQIESESFAKRRVVMHTQAPLRSEEHTPEL